MKALVRTGAFTKNLQAKLKESCYCDSFVLPSFSVLTPKVKLVIIAAPSRKLQLNNPLCFVHSSTAGHAATAQYSKPEKSLYPLSPVRMRTIELGHDKQQLYAVLLSCPFLFFWHIAYKNDSTIVKSYKIKNF